MTIQDHSVPTDEELYTREQLMDAVFSAMKFDAHATMHNLAKLSHNFDYFTVRGGTVEVGYKGNVYTAGRSNLNKLSWIFQEIKES